MKPVRTRIAPSPTGDPHVGTAYIALFNLCFAKQLQGEFILRIEDTDQVRSTVEAEQAIMQSLRWLGLEWDEGPDIGGNFGPYRQSERQAIYQQYCQQLIDQGDAFYCYRTAEELEEMRAERKAKGLFSALKPSDLALPDAEVAKRKAAGAPFVVRMKVPEEEGSCHIQDLLRGEIACDWAQVDAQILLKSDGLPTYHLANVVDDHLMGITHVIRGEEWINSAPKHQLLYAYFGWDMPILCHLPLLRNPDKTKLSKRKNPTSIGYYEQMGFLPEALVNYLGRMGWSMPNEQEKFTLTEMINHFDIQRVSLGGPIFDVDKLTWLNGKWLREDLSSTELVERLIAWRANKSTLMQIIPALKQRMSLFSDFVDLADFLFAGKLALNEAEFATLELDTETQLQLMQMTLWQLEATSSFANDALFEQFKALASFHQLKIKQVLAPFFIAITGKKQSISVIEAMVLLGPDLTKARLRDAMACLGGISKKKMKALEKQYRLFCQQLNESS